MVHVSFPFHVPGHKVRGSAIVDAGHESGFRNYFRIEYHEGAREDQPALDSAGWIQVGYTDLFNVVGKVAFREIGLLSPGVYVPLLLDE